LYRIYYYTYVEVCVIEGVHATVLTAQSLIEGDEGRGLRRKRRRDWGGRGEGRACNETLGFYLPPPN
jgi:hypothetical protein